MRAIISILLKIAICLVFFIYGCASQQERAAIRPSPNSLRWIFLASHIKNYFNTDMTVEEIAAGLEADFSYHEYLSEGFVWDIPPK